MIVCIEAYGGEFSKHKVLSTGTPMDRARWQGCSEKQDI